MDFNYNVYPRIEYIPIIQSGTLVAKFDRLETSKRLETRSAEIFVYTNVIVGLVFGRLWIL